MSTIRLKRMMKKAPNSTTPWITGRSEALDRAEDEAADAGDVEDGLGEDRVARQQDPDVEPEQRDDRRDRGSDTVAADHLALREPLGARSADVVLVHHLDQARAHVACVDRRRGGGEHEPGQDEGERPVRRAIGERHVAADPGEDRELRRRPAANRYSATSPSQKTGAEISTRVVIIVVRSSSERLRIAEMIPVGIPITSHRIERTGDQRDRRRQSVEDQLADRRVRARSCSRSRSAGRGSCM